MSADNTDDITNNTKQDNIKTEEINESNNKEFELTNSTIKPKKYTKKLPKAVLGCLDTLMDIEKFIRKNDLQNLKSMKDDFEPDEYKELSRIVELFNELMEVIEAYNSGQDFTITRPSTKCCQLMRLYDLYK
jgi:hypothetical protein